ncbi:MAG: hypothetical protein E5X80_04480 [Mesorhizobium sp.]|nr:MAG: hypothetical protein EOR71_21890 [Mesorhizobium sp.]TIO53073.1 MAG: hypothetical protein E5X78_10565 [Mesorhizobium sp.]TIO61907.1 MAG: hypothetical protein E5X79_05955 [Mesorhizobium sp.]TJV66779.1 MAG: hypothetical protein E5X80_04480 [Mesorhizobium sp.]
MSSSQMERYVWASVLYYAVAVVGILLVFVSINLGILRGLLATIGYFMLLILLNAWRRRRHPQSAYQVELAKRKLGD